MDSAKSTVNYTMRIDRELKKECEEIFDYYGINMATAFNMFLHTVRNSGGIPLDIAGEKRRSEAYAALEEARRIVKDPTVKRYSDVEEALRELKK
ncbi:MAG: type II toxin-antitoxin system RelB/DinJ family antitoxin [Clostridia bacterium]|nr:type II toxin-antitoxin system RelB/DinJ family antitoxin [Clostridia bacterium]